MSEKITSDECAALCEQIGLKLPASADRTMALKEAAHALSASLRLTGDQSITLSHNPENLLEHELWMNQIVQMLKGHTQGRFESEISCQRVFETFAARYTVEPFK